MYKRQADGGSDKDRTTLSADTLQETAGNGLETAKDGYFYGVSNYLPYGAYIAVEQQPYSAELGDFYNKHYKTDKPKEIILPALYEEGGNEVSPEKLSAAYRYNSTDTPEKLQEKYHIRMNEEWADTHTDDLRNYVIRAHNHDGDFEIYKYGLDADKLTGKIIYPGGSYNYQGFTAVSYTHLEDFIARMMTLGYQTKWRERGTYITFTNSNNQKVRNSRIDISKEEILKKFEENSKRSKSEIDICEQLEIKRNAASKNKDIFVYTFSRNCQQCHTVNELLTYMVFDDDTDENLVFPWDRERLFSSQDAISFFKHMLYEESEYYSYQVLGENKKLDQLMLKKFPETIRMEYSKTLKEKYAMNICPKCNGVGMGKHGKNFLHVLLDQKIKNMEKIKVIDVLELSQY